jgi:hypothetical protein
MKKGALIVAGTFALYELSCDPDKSKERRIGRDESAAVIKLRGRFSKVEAGGETSQIEVNFLFENRRLSFSSLVTQYFYCYR